MTQKDKITGWITVKGRHIPLFNGESAESAYKRTIKKAKKVPTKEEKAAKALKKSIIKEEKADLRKEKARIQELKRENRKDPYDYECDPDVLRDRKREERKARAELRQGSLQALITNAKEPKYVRKCLKDDNKRLVKQLITGKR